MAGRIGARAIVVGAGMGGLTAARALSDHFERVLILESDGLPVDPLDRAGIPQGRHVHALLAGGQRALEDLFPGFEGDLARAGAVSFRVGLDVRAPSAPASTPSPSVISAGTTPCPGPSSSERCAATSNRAARSQYASVAWCRSSWPAQTATRSPACGAQAAEVQHLLKPRRVYQDPTLVQRVLAVLAE